MPREGTKTFFVPERTSRGGAHPRRPAHRTPERKPVPPLDRARRDLDGIRARHRANDLKRIANRARADKKAATIKEKNAAPATARAKDLLRRELKDGPKMKGDVVAAAKEEGIGAGALRSAQIALEVQSRRTSKPVTKGNSVTEWSLPVG